MAAGNPAQLPIHRPANVHPTCTEGRSAMLTLELDRQERQLLIEILEAAETQNLHELHHADSSDYKRMLRARLEAIQGMAERLQETAART
jgi:hypothetical protein